MTKTYDRKCWTLAARFLRDHPQLNGGYHANELASEIQQTIEDYIEAELNKLDPSHSSNRGFDGPGGAE